MNNNIDLTWKLPAYLVVGKQTCSRKATRSKNCKNIHFTTRVFESCTDCGDRYAIGECSGVEDPWDHYRTHQGNFSEMIYVLFLRAKMSGRLMLR